MKSLLKVASLIVLILSVVGCQGAQNASSATETPVPASITEPTAQADAVVGDWQGTPLTESALRARMAKAGWQGLVDYVTEDVSGYGHVSRLIFGGIAEEQAHALEVAEAVAKEFGGVLWFMYGAVGSGQECGWRHPQQGLNMLRIEVYSTDAFLPEETSCRQAPG